MNITKTYSNKTFYTLAKKHAKIKSKNTLDELTECYDNLFIEDLARDYEVASKVFNNLPADFHEYLADSFILDLNESPEFWLIYQNAIYLLLNSENAKKINRMVETKAAGTDASDLYLGIRAIEHEAYTLALEYFSNCKHYIANYFTAICYSELQNLPNAVKNYLIFEKGIVKFINSVKEFNLNENFTLNFLRSEIKIELLTLYNRQDDYIKAIKAFEDYLTFQNLTDAFYIHKEEKNSTNGRTDFEVIVNHYLFSLEKTKQFSKANKFIKEVLQLQNTPFYIKWQKRLIKNKKSKQTLFNDKLIKKAFGIHKFSKTNHISREKNLEDMILEQIKYGYKVFGKSLEVYNTETIYGRQYFMKDINGYLDLLLIEKATNTLYIIELKRYDAGIEVYHQVKNYMQALAKEIDLPIKGIIGLHKPLPELTDLIKIKDDVTLFEYNFEFKQLA